MKITELSLKAFRSWQDTTINMDAPRVFLVGTNNAGKTSCREAIRWLFSGRCQGTDGKGAGAHLLVPDGFEPGYAMVAAEIAGIGAVQRLWNPAGGGFTVKGFTGDKTAQQAGLLLKLQTTEAFLAAALDTAVFLNLGHADAKALVLSLLNVQVPVEDPVLEAADRTYSLDELDAAYKQAFDDRRTAKIKLKACVVPPMPQGEVLSLSAINDRLADLRKALDEVLTTAGATVQRRAMLVQRSAELVPLTCPLSPDAVETLPGRIADLEERLAIMEAEATPVVESKKRPAKTLEGASVAEVNARIETLAGFKPTGGCIIDPKVSCKTAKLLFVNRGKDLQGWVDEQGEPDASEAPKSGPSLTAVRRELEALRAQQATVHTILQTNSDREAQTQELDAALSSLPDTSAEEAKAADLRKRIGVGEGKRQESEAHQKATESHQKGLEAQKALQVEVDRLEALVERLGPSGARVEALAKALDPFLAAINSYTAVFGWSVAFQLDPWAVVVNTRPVETYSRSEQYRIGLAIQLAVAALSGLGFAVVDELDMLDLVNRDVVGRMLLAAPLEQIIILGTRESTAPLPNIQGMVSYRIAQDAQGRSAIVERSEQ